MFLHQAIQMVLQQHGSKPLSIQGIATAINQQQLFHNEDDSQVTPKQVALSAASHIEESESSVLDVLIKLRKGGVVFSVDGKPAKLSDIRAQVRIAKLQAKGDKQRKT